MPLFISQEMKTGSIRLRSKNGREMGEKSHHDMDQYSAH